MTPSTTSHLGPLEAQVRARLAAFDAARTSRRIWDGDVTVWKEDPSTAEVRDRLGWLRVSETMAPQLPALRALAESARGAFDRIVLCGMGGSSLAPEVLWRSFGARPGFPRFDLLDSTDPRTVEAVTAAAPLDRTLVIVASKSGGTLETDSMLRHFWERMPFGDHYVAITDPGTSLARLGTDRLFRHVFLNPPDIGGRYSALSLFGLVPAALCGVDVGALLERGARMAAACGPEVPAARHPGLWLGAVLGEAARSGRDKLTLVLGAELASFGAWVEQLVAESTGKEGRGILPVVCEPLGDPGVYGGDRVFATLERDGEPPAWEERLSALAAAGHPVVRSTCAGALDLGAEFFRWEFATAVAGAVLGIHPFDQPNVAESKRNTQEVLARGEPLTPASTVDAAMALLGGVRPGDYLAILAYLPATPDHDRRLAAVRERLRDRLRVATTVGYGPRYLHSTGQLHKGGPPRGRFLLVTATPVRDVPIPGSQHGFAAVQAAQAEGDLRALRARGLPVVRLEGLESLEQLS